MNIIRQIRDKLGIEGTNLSLDRPKITPTFLKNLLLYIVVSRSHPIKVPYYPLTLMVEVSTGCNLLCERCERQITPKSILNHFTSTDLINRISPILPYIYSVYLVSGLGESFLNPNLWGVCRELKKGGVRVGFFTNGVLLNENNREKIFEEKIESVLISVDSYKKEKFEQIRKGANYNNIIDNIKALVKEKKKNDSKLTIGLSFTFQGDTVEEMPKFVSFAKKLGVDFVSFAGVIAHCSKVVPDSTFWIDKNTVGNIFKQTEKISNILTLPIRLPKLDIDPNRLCEDMWRNMYIFYNGDVCPCPHYRRPKTYYFCMENGEVENKNIKTPGLVLGNIYKDSILKIWNNRKYQDIRKRMKNNKSHPPCDKCYFRYGVH